MLSRLIYLSIILSVLLFQSLAKAQDYSENQPGKFDFYIFSLSWSPSYCENLQERGMSHSRQCGPRPYSFVVHGLWPQYENGFPKNCIDHPPD